MSSSPQSLRAWTESFAPLRHRDFAWYLASRSVTLLGTTMASVALAFAVLDLTGSTTALGQVLAARTVPLILVLLFGGVVADRLPRSLVLQGANLASAATQGATAVLLLTGHARLWSLVVLQGLGGLASGLEFPAMAGMVPTLVPRGHLQRANALVSMSRGLSAVLGPSLGALAVVTVGSGWAVLIDAATWVGAALLLLPVRRAATLREPAPGGASVVTELRQGWALFRGTTWLWVVVGAFGVLNGIGSGAWLTLGPSVASRTIGRQAWGWVLSAESVGVLLATVLLLRLPLTRPLRVGMLAVSALGVPIALLGLHPRTGILLASSFLGGVGVEIFGIGWNLAVQEHIEESQLSRAYSYDALGSYAAMPLGQLTFGPLGEHFGNGQVVAVSGLVYVAVALSVLASRSVRDLGRAPATTATG